MHKLFLVLISLSDLEGLDEKAGFYLPGTVVKHLLYGYRGVIVDFESRCSACDSWYFANKSQPAKEQPWYNILVHNSGGLSTYVAHSNLEIDQSGESIVHPRVFTYFSEFCDGVYTLKNAHHSGNP